MANKKRPKVGVGVLIFKKGKVLMAKRKGAHGAGEWAFPGGHLEFFESIEDCAKRECMEEAGIEIKNIKLLRISNLKKYGGKHYLDVGILAEWKAGEPKVMEPHKSEEWAWFELDNLPEPMFEACKHTFEALKTGQNFFDS